MTNFETIKPSPSAPAATVIIEQTFTQGRQDQFMRELVINEMEAEGVSEVRNTAIRLTDFGEKGGVKRAIVGDGEGMSPDKIADYQGSLFSGKKPVSIDGNFNTGGRAATLPLNPLGMLVASWTEGDEVGALIHLAKDPDTGLYVKRMFENEDGTLSEIGIPHPELRHPLIEDRGHGTVVILLGENPEDHTVGEIARRPDKKLVYPSTRYTQGDRLYFNAKFYTLPKGVALKTMWANNDMQVWMKDIHPGEWFEHAEARTRAGKESPSKRSATDTGSNYTFRAIQGVRDRIEKYASGTVTRRGKKKNEDTDHGSVAVHSRRGYPAIVHWALFTESKYERFTEEGGGASDTTDYGVPLGLFGELLEGSTPEGKTIAEVYNVAYHGAARVPMERYGISRKELRDRLVIIVEPGKPSAKFMGAVASSSRSHLVVPGGDDEGRLPHEEWGESFATKMPQAIKDRLKDLDKANDDRTMREKKLRARLTDWFKRRTKEETVAGSATGDTVEGEGGSGGDGGDLPGTTEPHEGAGTPCPEGCTCGKHHPAPPVDTHKRPGTVGGTGFKVDHEAGRDKSFATIPTVRWEGADEFGGQESLLVRSAGLNLYYINRDHPYLKAIVKDEVSSRSKSKAEDIPRFVENAITDHVISHVMSMKLYRNSDMVPVGSTVTSGYLEAALSDEALSASLLNMVTMQAILSGAFKGHTGFGRLDGSEDEIRGEAA